MTFPFDGYEVETAHRPSARGYAFDLDSTLSAVVALEARVPGDAFTANSLGTDRLGNGAVIGPNGLVLTIGYLVTEAADITLTLENGRRVAAHALGVDAVTGFGLVQALEPLTFPSCRSETRERSTPRPRWSSPAPGAVPTPPPATCSPACRSPATGSTCWTTPS